MFKTIIIKQDKKFGIFLQSIHLDSSQVPVKIWEKCLASIHSQKNIVIKIYSKKIVLAKTAIDEGSYNSIIEFFIVSLPKNKADKIETKHDIKKEIKVELK